MPDLPYQMNWTVARGKDRASVMSTRRPRLRGEFPSWIPGLGSILLAGMGCVMLCGCTARHLESKPQVHQLQLPADAGVRVYVYGDLIRWLPRLQRTPALELFLYGPRDESDTLLRNPFGLERVGELLLVCDQGRAGVMAVNLRTGSTASWGQSMQRSRCPVDIAVDEGGCVYLADTTLRTILLFDPSGRFIQELSPTADPSGFRPAAVHAHRGTLYVGDLAGSCVQRWDIRTRQWQQPIGPTVGDGRLISPTGLAVTADGTLLIADAVAGVVARVDANGQGIKPIGRPGRLPGQFVRPKHVAVLASGLIAVTDAGRQSVQLFGADGNFLAEIHEQSQWRGFTLPAGVRALSAELLECISVQAAANGWPMAGEYLIVSDSLGGWPLTVLGITQDQTASSPND